LPVNCAYIIVDFPQCTKYLTAEGD